MKMMKRFLAIILVTSMLVLTLASCGAKLSGTYEADAFGTGTKYTFNGDKVKMTVTVVGMVAAELEGTYELGDGTITLTFSGENAEQYSGTFEFSMDEEGESIMIGLFEYKKAD